MMVLIEATLEQDIFEGLFYLKLSKRLTWFCVGPLRFYKFFKAFSIKLIADCASLMNFSFPVEFIFEFAQNVLSCLISLLNQLA